MSPQCDPDIVTKRLWLRRFHAHDLSAMVAYRRQPDVARYQHWAASWTMDDALRFLAHQESLSVGRRGEWLQLAIEELATGALCGDVGVHFVESQPGTVELSVTIVPDHQRLGFGTEAVTAVLDWLFADLAMHRVFVVSDRRNAAFHHLIEGLGFRMEATHLESDWFRGEWATSLVHALLDREWRDTAR